MSKSKKSDALNDKQKRFCDEYIIDLDGTRAAIAAGYSEKTARTQASQMLSIVKVQEYIQKRKIELDKRLEDRYNITKEKVLDEFARSAFSDIRVFFNEDGSMKKLTDLTKDEAASLSSIESDEIKVNGKKIGVTQKIKVYDKLTALHRIAQVMGYYAPVKQDHTTKGESLNKGFYDFLKASSIPKKKDDEVSDK